MLLQLLPFPFFFLFVQEIFYVVFLCKIRYRKVIQSCDGKPENVVVSE